MWVWVGVGVGGWVWVWVGGCDRLNNLHFFLLPVVSACVGEREQMCGCTVVLSSTRACVHLSAGATDGYPIPNSPPTSVSHW